MIVEMEGELFRDVPIAIECRIFDRENVLLAKYAPALMHEEVKRIKAGKFYLKEEMHLPMNMTNGEYRMEIAITHPNVEYLAKIPNAVRLSLSGYISPTGNPMVYTNHGLLYLE